MPGSITKRSPGTYRLQVSTGPDFRGDYPKFTKTVHCKSDKEAEKELALFYAACVAGDVDKPMTTTVEAFCDEWIRLVKTDTIKNSTLVTYSSVIKNHIKPDLGSHKVSKLKAKNIQEWVRSLANEKGLSPKTIRNYFSVLSDMLDSARKWGYVRSNECELVDLPKIIKTEANYYRKEEVTKIVELLSNVDGSDLKYRVAVTLALFSGMRLGEIMGLKWDDIDMDKRTVDIKRNRLYRPNKGVYVDTPKSGRSIRILTIPQGAIDLLKALQRDQRKMRIKLGSKWIDTEGYVFHGRMGGAMFPNKPSLWWHDFQDQNGVRRITFHQLRHTHASLLAFMDIDKMKISARLGHANLSTTMNIYTHLFEEADQEIADRLDNFCTIFAPSSEIK